MIPYSKMIVFAGDWFQRLFFKCYLEGLKASAVRDHYFGK